MAKLCAFASSKNGLSNRVYCASTKRAYHGFSLATSDLWGPAGPLSVGIPFILALGHSARVLRSFLRAKSTAKSAWIAVTDSAGCGVP